MKRSFIILLISITSLTACGKRKSKVREYINTPENGYMQEIKTEAYTINIQYQPPAYRADQEIMLNKSTVSKSELIQEYDQLQQFLVKYKMTDPNVEVEPLGMMERFNLVTSDTIPCIDAHAIPYSPGAPDIQVLLLFPLSEKELGKEFKLIINGFPETNSFHEIKYQLNKKD